MAVAAVRHSGIQVELPVQGDNKKKWDTLGVKWLSSFAENPFLASAELPSGWSLREKPASDFDKRSFVVLDDTGMPKANVNMKTAPWDKWAVVNLVSSATAAKMKVALAPKPDQEEFDSLLSRYNAAVRTTYGMGSRGQIYIDEAYENLKAFIVIHPGYSSELPSKYRCQDDGAAGLSGVMMGCHTQ